jgi:hypothetical protein
VKQLRVAEVLAVRLVKAFHLLWSWFGCPGNHLIGHPLQPELALNLLAQLAILECCAAVACHFLPLDGLLEGARVDGPGIVGRGLFEQQSVDGRVLRRSPRSASSGIVFHRGSRPMRSDSRRIDSSDKSWPFTT